MILLDLFSPRIAYASVDSFVAGLAREIINPSIIFLFAVAIGAFLWGMVECLRTQFDEEGRTKCRQHMLWGIIGIALMISVWTILNIVLNTLNIDYVEVDDGNIRVDRP